MAVPRTSRPIPRYRGMAVKRGKLYSPCTMKLATAQTWRRPGISMQGKFQHENVAGNSKYTCVLFIREYVKDDVKQVGSD